MGHVFVGKIRVLVASLTQFKLHGFVFFCMQTQTVDILPTWAPGSPPFMSVLGGSSVWGTLRGRAASAS